MKDLFSEESQTYQSARPRYSQQLITAILEHVPARQWAWDVGCGSGQFTQLVAAYFERVLATDLSVKQLEQAQALHNVQYQAQEASNSGLADHSVDLVTVAQAVHWFDFEKFYLEVKRVLKPNGVFAVVGYGLIQIQDQALQAALKDLYFNTLKNYWDPERRYVDEEYQSIPFPFQEIDMPKLELRYQWSHEQLFNYLTTWSAVQHYERQTEQSALTQMVKVLQQHPEKIIEVCFPVLLRVGRA